jgi:hypothetical protein
MGRAQFFEMRLFPSRAHPTPQQVNLKFAANPPFFIQPTSITYSAGQPSKLRRFRFSSVRGSVCLFVFSISSSSSPPVYGTGTSAAFGFTGDNYPNSPSLKPRTSGFIVGATYILPSLTRFKSGLDLRSTFSPGYNGGKLYTGGVRFSWVPYRFPLRPYAGFGGGIASTQLHDKVCTGSTCTQRTDQITGGVVEYNAGLDIRLTRWLDLRAIDYQAASGGSRGTTSAAARSLSGGVVFRLGPRQRANP